VVRAGQPPWGDADDAAGWRSMSHCSHLSLDRKGAPPEIPDVANGGRKNPNRRKGRLPA